MPHDVFISHSHADHNVATAICAHLEGRGIRCWLAPRDVKPGSVWAAEVLGALKASRALVLVWSKESNVSDQVLRELERAVNAGVPIVPFRIHEGAPSQAMEYLLAATHWLDALTPPLERHIEHLGDSLDALLHRAPLPRPEPRPVPRPGGLRWLRLAVPLLLVGLGVGIAALAGWFRRDAEPSNPSPPPAPAPAPAPAPPPAPAETSIAAPWLEQHIERERIHGLVVHSRVVLVDRRARPTVLRATFHRADGTPLKDLDGYNATEAGDVAVERKVVPGEDTATFADLDLFLPYVDLHLHEDQPPGEQRTALTYRLEAIAEENGAVLASTQAQAFEVTSTTPAEGWARFRRVWVTEGGTETAREVVVHAEMRVRWRIGKPTLVQAFFSRQGGLPLKDFDGAFATQKGFVAVSDTVSPLFEDAIWDDYTLRIPLDQLHLDPGSLHELEVVLQVRVPATGDVLGESLVASFRAGTR